MLHTLKERMSRGKPRGKCAYGSGDNDREKEKRENGFRVTKRVVFRVSDDASVPCTSALHSCARE